MRPAPQKPKSFAEQCTRLGLECYAGERYGLSETESKKLLELAHPSTERFHELCYFASEARKVPDSERASDRFYQLSFQLGELDMRWHRRVARWWESKQMGWS